MGRFYKTSAQTPVDYMYELPKELMMGALLATDKKVEKSLTAADEAKKAFDLIKNLKGDNEFVNSKYAEYEQKINDLSNKILKDPMKYGALGGQMREVAREIEQDVKRGSLHFAQQQYEEFEKFKEIQNKRVDIDQAKKQDLINHAEASYGSLNYESPSSYNEINKHYLPGYSKVNEDELINTLGANFEADTTSYANAGVSGMYLTQSSGTKTERKDSSIKKVVDASLESSGWLDYNREGIMLDKEFGRIPADADVDEILNQRKQKLVDKAVEKLGYSKTTSQKSMSGDPMYAVKKAEQEERQRTEGIEVKADIGDDIAHRLYKGGNSRVKEVVEAGKIPGAKTVEDVVFNMKVGKKGSTYTDVKKIMLQTPYFKNSSNPDAAFRQWYQASLNDRVEYHNAPKGIVNLYNEKSLNTPTKLFSRDAQNNRIEDGANSLGDYISHMKSKGVIVLQPTGEFPSSTSATGNPLQGGTTATKVPGTTSYEFTGEGYKTQNLKKKTSYEVNKKGEVKPVTSYVDIIKVNTYNTKTKKYNLVEVEVEVPEQDLVEIKK